MKRMWEIKNQAERTLDLYIYGDVEGDYWNFWTGEMVESETSANAFRDKLAEAGDLDEIHVYINSEGYLQSAPPKQSEKDRAHRRLRLLDRGSDRGCRG